MQRPFFVFFFLSLICFSPHFFGDETTKDDVMRMRSFSTLGVPLVRARHRGSDDDDDAFVQATTRREERLDKMRDYFGEKIALYFAFLEGLIHSLLPLALVGTPVALLGQAYYGTADNLGATVYSICVLIWITTLCHVWQRQEARLRHRWSTDGYEDHERIRSHRRQFDGEDAPGARGEPHVCA